MFEVYKLHIKELFRNNYIILTSILIPLFLFPLIYFGFTQFMMLKQGFFDNQKVAVYLDFQTDKYQDIKDSLEKIDNLEFLKSRRLEPYVAINVQAENQLPKFTIYTDSTNSVELSYVSNIKSILSKYLNQKIEAKAHLYNDSASFYQVFNIKSNDINSKNEFLMKIFAMLIPMFSIISIIAGAGMSSIEITAGEKENKAVETLFVTPLSRKKILSAKILVTATFALISGIVNFIIMVVVLLQIMKFIFKMLDKTKALNLNIDYSMLFDLKIAFIVIFTLVLLALMSSIIFVTVAFFAKTKKEANVVLSPVSTILSFLPFIAIIPALDTNLGYSLIPLANLSLAIKMVIMNDLNYLFLTSTIVVSCIYLYLVYQLLLPMMEDEDVILGSNNLSLKDKLKRRFKKKGN